MSVSSVAERKLAALAVTCVSLIALLCTAAPAGAATGDQFSCRASALRVQGVAGLVGLNAEPTVANSAGTPCANDSATTASTPPILDTLLHTSASALSASTAATATAASASSTIAHVTVLGTTLKLTTDLADATAAYVCSNGQPMPVTGSNVVYLSINGSRPITTSQPVSVPGLGLADVELNETLTGAGSVTQRAVDIKVLSGVYGGAEIVLGEATAGYSGNPCANGGNGQTGGGTGGGGLSQPPTFSQTPQASTDSGNANFTYGSSDPNAQLQCSLDAAPYTPCSGHTSFSGLSIGRHTFAVRAVVNGVPGPATVYTWYVRRGCPPATGSVHGRTLGLVHLGMTRKQARRAYRYSTDRGKRFEDFFCVKPQGVRVGYASTRLLKTLRRSQRRHMQNHVVLVLSANRRYAVRGIRAGSTLKQARNALGHGSLFHVGRNYWYLVHRGGVTYVLKVRRGKVEEVGIATASLTRGHRAQSVFIHSFS